MLTSFQQPSFHPSQLFTMFMIGIIGAAVIASLGWDFSAKVVPLVVGTVGLIAAALSLFIFSVGNRGKRQQAGGSGNRGPGRARPA